MLASLADARTNFLWDICALRRSSAADGGCDNVFEARFCWIIKAFVLGRVVTRILIIIGDNTISGTLSFLT